MRAKKPQKFPLNPKHPERICWGCDKYCPADNLMCGNGSGRTEHPAEIMGEDWYAWGLDNPDMAPVKPKEDTSA
jgi:hypothetical protein